jgi:hypothetical protein
MSQENQCPKCVFWIITADILTQITRYVLTEKNEISGAILFDDENHNSTSYILNKKGNVDSVQINVQNNHILSFHTHPISAYANAGCVYGHPSSDDLAEYIRLAISYGLINHAVFTLEGVYLVQVRRSFVKWMREPNQSSLLKEIKDQVYDYFHSFHKCRTLNYVKENNYDPDHFTKKVNNYRYNNLKKIFKCIFFPSSVYNMTPDDIWITYINPINKTRKHDPFFQRDLEFIFMELSRTKRTNDLISTIIDHCPPCEES